MPTDTPADEVRRAASSAAADELVFAAQDLGQHREQDTQGDEAELGFALAPRAASAPAQPAPAPSRPRAADDFVLRDPQRVAPTASIDTLVVGATTPPAAATQAAEAVAPVPRPGFRVYSAGPAPVVDAHADPPWLELAPAPQPAAASSRRGWTTRHSAVAGRSAEATMLRLRQEAVDVSWQCAWIAVSAADPRLSRRRLPVAAQPGR